jgi:ATPase subunit of ABC transporter with duplicated ATPase domains
MKPVADNDLLVNGIRLAIGMGIQAEEAERVLESVGFNAEMRQKAIASLSGGWKMKLALGARAFYHGACLC